MELAPAGARIRSAMPTTLTGDARREDIAVRVSATADGPSRFSVRSVLRVLCTVPACTLTRR